MTFFARLVELGVQDPAAVGVRAWTPTSRDLSRAATVYVMARSTKARALPVLESMACGARDGQQAANRDAPSWAPTCPLLQSVHFNHMTT